ncbi:MAG: hypothetical protein A2X67_12930 [Ignavibacteria bacterium GWA2_55_11]|nr:MAG: hypothetical protein A2X67_12930 [Ignavibacteria bacterium GWA2_55_11]OGU45791.1 MAG: hypothetical protein A2X68_01505 [Ignavibacteria bacterium GWC2_56_12]OGU68229.1 MAG: hypothetical protein A3C56_02190 [Ignavibacteria bacterium RIFCSPHIGHO2_02_FULL_56_12]OGU68883.1 MAG: hypothetical protein A3H45_00310 [Ignavibacteria bacterium RIFCSPLOWO2_02_FULL_55_14]OGU76275.1 MAG: hypothetical protein A3G43_11035 [Ignavibacteria bacterium RIFCSPLOWO2_12_FULL_56_21]HAV23652.1 hypothetical protei
MPVIIFKAVERCNSNCIYCDVIKKRQNTILSSSLLELVFQRINEYLCAHPRETMTLTWHGGEVCLLGPEYFRLALEHQKKHCPQTQDRIEHLVQSNLTLLTQELIEVFRQLGIRQIGSSYEPIPGLRGFGKNRDSDAYNRAFMRSVELLEENNIYWGVIYVVHRKSLAIPLELFYHLTNMNLRSQPNFNMVWVYGSDEHELAITPEEFADFLGAIFPVWWKHRVRFPHVKPFEGIIRSLRDRNVGLVCESSGSCTYEWVYIGPEGHTSQCGKAGDYNMESYGRIQDCTLESILHDARRDAFLQRQSLLPETECRECRLWGICHGGCPLESKQHYGTYMHKSPNCAATKRLIERYIEPVTGLHADFPAPVGSLSENTHA